MNEIPPHIRIIYIMILKHKYNLKQCNNDRLRVVCDVLAITKTDKIGKDCEKIANDAYDLVTNFTNYRIL